MKGQTDIAVAFVVSIMVVGLMIGFGLKQQDYVQRKFHEQTTGLVADRITGNIYALDSYPRGSIQMNLRREYEISTTPKNEVNVSFRQSWSTSELISETGIQFEQIEGQYLCASKSRGTIKVKGGKC